MTDQYQTKNIFSYKGCVKEVMYNFVVSTNESPSIQ